MATEISHLTKENQQQWTLPSFSSEGGEPPRGIMKIVDQYAHNVEEQELLEISKQKTVKEIDQKYLQSKVNQTYVFPLKIEGEEESSDDNNEESLEWLSDVTIYNLKKQKLDQERKKSLSKVIIKANLQEQQNPQEGNFHKKLDADASQTESQERSNKAPSGYKQGANKQGKVQLITNNDPVESNQPILEMQEGELTKTGRSKTFKDPSPKNIQGDEKNLRIRIKSQVCDRKEDQEEKIQINAERNSSRSRQAPGQHFLETKLSGAKTATAALAASKPEQFFPSKGRSQLSEGKQISHRLETENQFTSTKMRGESNEQQEKISSSGGILKGQQYYNVQGQVAKQRLRKLKTATYENTEDSYEFQDQSHGVSFLKFQPDYRYQQQPSHQQNQLSLSQKLGNDLTLGVGGEKFSQTKRNVSKQQNVGNQRISKESNQSDKLNSTYRTAKSDHDKVSPSFKKKRPSVKLDMSWCEFEVDNLTKDISTPYSQSLRKGNSAHHCYRPISSSKNTSKNQQNKIAYETSGQSKIDGSSKKLFDSNFIHNNQNDLNTLSPVEKSIHTQNQQLYQKQQLQQMNKQSTPKASGQYQNCLNKNKKQSDYLINNENNSSSNNNNNNNNNSNSNSNKNSSFYNFDQTEFHKKGNQLSPNAIKQIKLLQQQQINTYLPSQLKSLQPYQVQDNFSNRNLKTDGDVRDEHNHSRIKTASNERSGLQGINLYSNKSCKNKNNGIQLSTLFQNYQVNNNSSITEQSAHQFQEQLPMNTSTKLYSNKSFIRDDNSSNNNKNEDEQLSIQYQQSYQQNNLFQDSNIKSSVKSRSQGNRLSLSIQNQKQQQKQVLQMPQQQSQQQQQQGAPELLCSLLESRQQQQQQQQQQQRQPSRSKVGTVRIQVKSSQEGSQIKSTQENSLVISSQSQSSKGRNNSNNNAEKAYQLLQQQQQQQQLQQQQQQQFLPLQQQQQQSINKQASIQFNAGTENTLKFKRKKKPQSVLPISYGSQQQQQHEQQYQ